MAFKPVSEEFNFPDPDSDGSIQIEVEGNVLEAESKKASEDAAKAKAAPEVEIEVVDDRPPEDRNKVKAKEPEELSDEELESYSEKVRKRLKHFSKGFHDKRREAEEAKREKEEALRYAQQLQAEIQKLRGTVSKSQEVLLDQAKKVATQELEDAKAKYKAAYEAGDSDALVEAQEALTSAKMKVDKVENVKLPPLQAEENDVQTEPVAPRPTVDKRAVDWQQRNTWFGQDDEMTSFALGLHQKLVKQGVDPKSDEYYEKIDSRMRQVFPEQFSDEEEAEVVQVAVEPKRKVNVVAPSTRSVAPKKITLTRTQVALAKRLGVPLELYAKQAAEEEMRNQNGR